MKRDSAFKVLSPVPGTACVYKTLASIVTIVPWYLYYIPVTAYRAPTSPGPAVHHTLHHISETQTISYKEDSTIPSPTKE